jgi:hypothetical protein
MRLTSALLFLGMTFTAHAEVKLTENDILGVWQIDSESTSSDGTHAKKLNSTWNFLKDGTMEGITHDHLKCARALPIPLKMANLLNKLCQADQNLKPAQRLKKMIRK